MGLLFFLIISATSSIPFTNTWSQESEELTILNQALVDMSEWLLVMRETLVTTQSHAKTQ